MNRFAALSLELSLELSPSSQAQTLQAKTKFAIKFATKLLPVQGSMNRRPSPCPSTHEPPRFA